MAVPTFRGPGFGGDVAGLLDQVRANSASRTQAELTANSEIMRNLMNNAPEIAQAFGGAVPDRIAQSMGGAKDVLFGGDYASAMDRLNMQKMQADIARLNRVGKGGGGGSSGGGKATEWLIRNGQTGEETWVDPSDLDASVLSELRGAGGEWQVLRYGRLNKTPSGINVPPSGDGGGSGDLAGVTKVGDTYYDDVTGQPVE